MIKMVFAPSKWVLVALLVATSVLTIHSQEINAKKLKIKLSENSKELLSNLQNANTEKTDDGIILTGNEVFDQLNRTFQVTTIERVFPYNKKFNKRHEQFGLHLWYELKIANNAKIDIAQCKNSFQTLSSVDIAEHSYIKQLHSTIQDTVNDPRMPEQWHYNNYGTTGGIVDADIDLQEAWTIESGSSDVIVAVIDGGIDYNHEDLAENMWVNEAELNGTENVDDDNNGYVDDIHGYGFGDNLGNYYPHNHGTHVGGTISAVNDNGVGVCGIAGGNSQEAGVRLMSCAVFGTSSQGGFDESFVYAADNGAVIAQNSWSYGGPDYFEQSELDAIDYFIANAGYDENMNPVGPMQGGIVIFSAGNDNSNGAFYPGYYEPVLAVASTDQYNDKAWYSNYGDWVDIAAPGGETNISYQGVLSTLPNDTYGFYQGTSMACPHVSGVAALIVSKFGGTNLTPEIVRLRLTETVDDIDSYNVYDGLLGSGKLNAYNALLSDDNTPPDPISDLTIIDTTATSITLQWTATGFSADSGTASFYDLRVADFEITAENFNTATQVNTLGQPLGSGIVESYEVTQLNPDTQYWLAIKAGDYFGNIGSISNITTCQTRTAPQIQFTPEMLVHSVDSGVTMETSFIVSNIGEGLLNFEITNFSQVSATTANINQKISVKEQEFVKGEPDTIKGKPVLKGYGDDGVDGFGYSWIDSDEPNGPVFNWVDISEQATYLSLGDDYYATASLPFEFPFYGETKSHIYISSNGLLTFHSSSASSLSNRTIPHTYTPNDLIALMWDDLYAGSNEIYYYGDESKFVVTYENVGELSTSYESDFQAILYPNGTIVLQYLKKDGNYTGHSVGIENANGTLGLEVAYNTTYLKDSLAIRISSSPLFISDIFPLNGELNSGEDTNIDVELSSVDMVPGIYTDSIRFSSNDPVYPQKYLPVLMHVRGTPNIQASTDSLNFGKTFINYADSIELLVSNTGTDSLYVSNIELSNSDFSISEEDETFELYMNEQKSIWINFNPSSTNLYDDTLVIYNNTDSSAFQIALTGEGLYPPLAAISPESIEMVLNVGDSVSTPVTIDNTQGQSELNYNISFTNQTENSNAKIGFYADESRKPNKFQHPALNNKRDTQSYSGQLVATYYNVPTATTGVVIIGNYGYFVNWPNNTVETYDLTTQTVISSFTIHSQPSGITYDGTYLWIGNGSGNVYAYTLEGNLMGSFSSPFSDYIGLTYDGEYFVVSNIFTSEQVFYTLDHTGEIISYKNAYIYNLSQLSISRDRYFALSQGNLYELENQGNLYVIKDSLFHTNSDTYSLFVGNNAFLSPWDGPMYEVAVGISNWISASPSSGAIEAGETGESDIIINTKDMIAGFYNKTITVQTNDPELPYKNIPVNIEVHGTPIIASDADPVIFDSTYVGVNYMSQAVIRNDGTDTLFIENIEISPSEFSFDSIETTILPHQNKTLTINFTPSTDGRTEGALIITSNDTINPEFTINLDGNAIYPPIASVSRDSIEYNLYSGETYSDSIVVTNNGGSELIFSVDYEYLTSIDSVDVVAADQKASPDSVGSVSELMPSYQNLVAMTINPNTGEIYALGRYSYSFYKYSPYTDSWNILSDNMYYAQSTAGLVYLDNKVYAAVNGVLTIYDLTTGSWSADNTFNITTKSLTTDGTYLYCESNGVLYKYDVVNQTITDLTNTNYYFGSNNDIVYYDGIIYIKNSGYDLYKYDIENDVFSILPSNPAYNSSSKIALDKGKKKIYTLAGSYFCTFDIETETWECEYFSNSINNGLIVYNQIAGYHGLYYTLSSGSNQFFRYETGFPYNWLNFNNTIDTLQAGESRTIDFGISTHGITGGTYLAQINVESNDPFNSHKQVNVQLNVEDAANISLSNDTLFIDNAYNDFTISDSVTVYNFGTDTLVVNSIHFDIDSVFSLDKNTLQIEPNDSATIVISALTQNTGIVSSELTFESNALPNGTEKLNITAMGKEAPILTLPEDELNVYVMPNNTLETDFAFTNSGGSELNYNVTGGNYTTIDTTSVQYITSSGEDTYHVFDNLNQTSDSLNLTITLNGDYSGSYSSENAELVIEGINYGVIDYTTAFDGQDYIRSYAFSGDTVNQWLSDGKLEVDIMNGYSVDPYYGNSSNKVQLFIKGVEWFAIENVSGTLMPNDSLILHPTFNSVGFEEGDYFTSFNIETNDPAIKGIEIPTSMKVRNQTPPIVAHPISDMIAYTTQEQVNLDISDVFFDVNHDALSYSVTSGNIESIFGQIQGSNLNLQLLQKGSALITVSATDGNFAPVATSFSVLVRENELPVFSSQLSIIHTFVNDSITLELNTLFTDADEDPLVFNAHYNTDSLYAVIAGDELTIASISEGQSSITIGATDSKSDTVWQTIEVIAEMQVAPIVANAIPDQVVTINSKSVLYNLNEVFSDANGDSLLFDYTINNQLLDSAEIINGLFQVHLKDTGAAKITVSATDGYFTTDTSFMLTIIEQGLPEVVKPMDDMFMSVTSEDYVVNLLNMFSDPEGDSLTFKVVNTQHATQTVCDSNILTFSFLQAGTDTIEIMATDKYGWAKDTVIVNVIENQAPYVIGLIHNQTMDIYEEYTVSLDTIFADDDLDELAYSVEMEDTTILNYSINLNILSINSKNVGSTKVTVYADDLKGVKASEWFSVSVNDTVNVSEFSKQPFTVYPNPFNDKMNIKYQLNNPSLIAIKLVDLNGKLIDVIEEKERLAGVHTQTFETDHIKAGVYFIWLISENNKPQVIKLIKN